MPNRTICDVLDAMRKCQSTHNYSYLNALIEEAQDMANRMEAALYDKNDLKHYQDMIKKRRKELEELEKKIEEVEDKK